jgi:hypothetical protein
MKKHIRKNLKNKNDKNKDDKQARVVRAIRALPPGTVSTYGAIAKAASCARFRDCPGTACSAPAEPSSSAESMPPNKDSACKWKASPFAARAWI